MICWISIVGGIDPNSKVRISIDLSIDGRGRFLKRSLRKSRTLSAMAASNLDQSRSTDMVWELADES